MNLQSSPISHPAGYRPDIDGLRALAVIAVVLYHGWPGRFSGGFVGVDIFFVISGYLITSIILGDLERRRFSILRFYALRIRRIFPALLLVLAATMAFGWVVLLPGEFKKMGLHVVAGGGFFSNLMLWHESGYFDTSATTKPLLHLWSLGIEEQFYAFWPILLWVCYRRKDRVAWLIGAIFVASFALNVAVVGRDPVAAFYSPLTRFWELMAGGLGAYLQAHGKHWPEQYRTAGSIGGLALLILGFLLIKPQDAFPGWWALLPVAGTLVLILTGPSAVVNRLLLGNRAAVGVGLVSYPLYLWHWPLLAYAFIVIGEKPSFLVRVSLIACSLLLAVLTYRLIERPIRKIAIQKKMVGTLAAGMGTAILAGTLIHMGFVRERLDAVGAEPYLEALNDTDFPGATFVPYTFNGATFQKVNSKAAGVTVFLGDSVVEQYGPFVEAAIASDPSNYRSAVFATSGNCPPIPHTSPLPKIRYRQCPMIIKAGYEYAERPEVQTVVIGGAWYGYFDPNGGGMVFDDGSGEIEFPDKRAQEAAYLALEQTLKRLTRQGKRVFLVLQPPMGPPFDPRNMITGSRFGNIRPVKQIAPLSLTRFISENASPHDRLISIARASGVELIDPTSFLCNANECPVVSDDGTPVYTDTMHMRPSFSRKAARFLIPALSTTDLAQR